MEEFRYRRGAILKNVLQALGAAFLASLVAAIAFFRWAGLEMEGWICGAFGFSLWIALLVLAGRRRWRSFIRIEEEGIAKFRSAARPVVRIAWNDVEEISRLAGGSFVVQGGGKKLTVPSDFERVFEILRRVDARVADSIRDHLRDRALRDGFVTFAMPYARWRAHLAYFGSILFITAVTFWMLSPLFRLVNSGFRWGGGGLIMLFWIGSLLRWRRKMAWRGARVTVTLKGIEIRRLDGRQRIEWSKLAGTEWNSDRGLDLLLHGGKKVSVPPRLANLDVLHEFIQNDRPRGESPAP